MRVVSGMLKQSLAGLTTARRPVPFVCGIIVVSLRFASNSMIDSVRRAALAAPVAGGTAK